MEKPQPGPLRPRDYYAIIGAVIGVGIFAGVGFTVIGGLVGQPFSGSAFLWLVVGCIIGGLAALFLRNTRDDTTPPWWNR